jgi:GR25 family glycosyltransferase involved in LPS biosynthesis
MYYSAMIFFKIHHGFSNIHFETMRDQNVNSIRSELDNYFQHLDAETIMVRNQADFQRHKTHFPKMRFHEKPHRKMRSADWLPGELGLMMSNYSALSEFIKSSESESDLCLLLESDVWIDLENEVFPKTLNSWVGGLPSDFDYFNLYIPAPHRYLYVPTNSSETDPIIVRNYAISHTPAILWSKKGANKFIQSCEERIELPLDSHVFENEIFIGYALTPESHEKVSIWTEFDEKSIIGESQNRINVGEK